MENEIIYQIQEAQRIPYRIDPRRNIPRHILIKLKKKKKKKKTKKEYLKQQGKSNK